MQRSTLLPKTIPIRIATNTEQQQVISTLVLAFHTDPAMRWLYSEPDQYQTYFPKFVQAFGGKAFEHNTVYCHDRYSGVALWYPPGVEPDLDPVIDLMLQSITEAELPEVFSVFKQVEHFHPTYPHWYLPFIGVEPSAQGQGYGSALLKPVLEQCDRDQIPAYLESSNPANLSFYERFGFEVLGKIQAGASPTIVPMIRYPH